MVVSNLGLLLSFLMIHFSCNNLTCVFLSTISFGFCAATFDIAYEAYRIEILENRSHAIGIATSVFGYRVGLLITGAGSLYLASIYGWNVSFCCTTILLSIGIVLALIGPAPQKILNKRNTSFSFTEFAKTSDAKLMIATIATYRVGEAMLGTMLIPFFLEIGFSKSEIATYAKLFSVVATVIGAYLGGMVVKKYGHKKALFICGVPQMLSNLSFIALNHLDHNIGYLTCAVVIEDLTAGMGTTAIVSYLCYLCNYSNTATQFATLSAIAAAANNSIPFMSGKIAEIYGWDSFFLLSTIIALPGVLLSYKLQRDIKCAKLS